MKTFISKAAIAAVVAASITLAGYARDRGNPLPGTDYSIHTLYIFNFTKYIEWPTESKAIKIGVVDNASAEEQLQKMAKVKSSTGSEISVVNTRNESELGACQIIFVPANNSSMVDRLIERFGNQPILIVTEESNLVKKGASISFKINAGKLRFQVNEEAIKSKGLKVSTVLTSLSDK